MRRLWRQCPWRTSDVRWSELAAFTTYDFFRFVGASLQGGLTCLLVAGGIFVLVSSVMALRRRELGVRAALGATPLRLTRLLLVEVMKPVFAGVAIGLFGVWSTTALVRGLLFQIEPSDVTTLVSVLATIGLLCRLIVIAPALRLRRMDLARTLSEE